MSNNGCIFTFGGWALVSAAIIITAFSLAACSGIPTGGHDKFGNETPAFGVTTARETSGTLHYAATDRSSLIAYCHDQHAFISGDGNSCAKPQYRIGKQDWCMTATVKGDAGDVEWMSAVCDGWVPEERI